MKTLNKKQPVFAGMTAVILLQNSSVCYAADNENVDRIELNGTFHFEDPDDHALCQPGESGTLKPVLDEIYGIQPTGTVSFRSDNPDCLDVDENLTWTAKKEGNVQLLYTIEYSQETLDALAKKFPNAAFTTSDTQWSVPMTVSNIAPVFRLRNPNTNEHLFTASRNERSELMKRGWDAEKIVWNQRKENGERIYRLYDKKVGIHRYTMDANEAEELQKQGWSLDDELLYSEKEEDVPVYSCLNQQADPAYAFYTTDENELKTLEKSGWLNQGVAFYSTSQDRISRDDFQ